MFTLEKNDYKDYIEAYREVFTEDGQVRACGRDACKRLIKLLTDMFPGFYFGNAETGFMDVENIRTAHHNILLSEKN